MALTFVTPTILRKKLAGYELLNVLYELVGDGTGGDITGEFDLLPYLKQGDQVYLIDAMLSQSDNTAHYGSIYQKWPNAFDSWFGSNIIGINSSGTTPSQSWVGSPFLNIPRTNFSCPIPLYLGQPFGPEQKFESLISGNVNGKGYKWNMTFAIVSSS